MMQRKFAFTAVLATTSSIALLAGVPGANAQDAAPVVCSTTQISPAKQNCVMPMATAPGGGSFPGSFLVPGTQTSFAVHGFIVFDIRHDFGPHAGDTQYPIFTIPLNLGPGITATTHSLNGGTTMDVKQTRPDIETRTPTSMGELKTYIEFDFNQTGYTQLAGNNDTLRLRQAYGTLGPWLIGQTYSLFGDLLAYPDVANGNQDAGILNTFNVRRPQIRYTWLAGKGLSIAGSVEEPSYVNNVVFSHAANTSAGVISPLTPTGAAQLNGTTAYYNWPAFVLATQWDQPWGHIRLAAAGGVNQVRQASPSPNYQTPGYTFALSGHLNTWGKDALRGGVWYNSGAADFNSDTIQGSEVYNDTTGTHKTTKAWAVYGSYEHFFNNHWRANGSMGFASITGNPFTVACPTGTNCPQAGLEKTHFTSELNVIYSPVAQTDWILEWQHAYRKVMSGADGTFNQIDAQFKFYF
jgi:Porin subfamily